ncbi:MAG: sulfurtransferase TusA family protein [Myxococcales bacterium]
METSLDARGKSCPMPIVLLAKALRDAGRGSQMTVRADDRAFPEDVKAWCRKTGNELVSLDNRPGYYEAVIRKA